MPEIKNWAPPHTMLYTAPPQREWDKPGISFNAWWDGDYDDSENPYEPDSAGYWAWAGWQAAQRQWVGLTDEEFHSCIALKNPTAIAEEVEAKLKERNT